MKIKICGITREEEIRFLNKLHPDYIGFVFADSKRKVSIEKAHRMLKILNKDIKAAAVFKDNSFEFICELLEKLPIDIVQLHGMESNDFIETVRNKYNVDIWKGICIKSEESLKYLDSLNADAVLLDGSKAGSGESFPWRYLKNIKTDKKIFLAGGINKSNINDAMSLDNVYGIDISSGAESTINGVCRKDELKVKTIIEKVRESNER